MLIDHPFPHLVRDILVFLAVVGVSRNHAPLEVVRSLVRFTVLPFAAPDATASTAWGSFASPAVEAVSGSAAPILTSGSGGEVYNGECSTMM